MTSKTPDEIIEKFRIDIEGWRSKLNPDKCFSFNQIEYLGDWCRDIFEEGIKEGRKQECEKFIKILEKQKKGILTEIEFSNNYSSLIAEQSRLIYGMWLMQNIKIIKELQSQDSPSEIKPSNNASLKVPSASDNGTIPKDTNSQICKCGHKISDHLKRSGYASDGKPMISICASCHNCYKFEPKSQDKKEYGGLT